MFTYAYFLRDTGWKPADGSLRVNSYEVTRILRVKGDVAVTVPPKVLRLEAARPLTAADQLPPTLFCGATQHLQYTDQSQRTELLAQATAEFAASPTTRALIIPIRKSQAWWDLAQDQRIAFFQTSADGAGHTAIGLPYVNHIFRKLYHCRYMESPSGFDFITYFEFHEQHAAEFLHLLQSLRDVKQNPEWEFVEAETEIWMKKVQ